MTKTIPIQEYVVKKALNASISPVLVKKVIYCESRWNSSARGDFGASVGLVQINLVAHPEISMKEALDPYFSVDFLISEWKQGRAWEWTCYNLLTSR